MGCAGLFYNREMSDHNKVVPMAQGYEMGAGQQMPQGQSMSRSEDLAVS